MEELQDGNLAVINQRSEQSTSENDNMFECQFCELTFNGVKPLEQHIQSKKHLNKKAEINQQGIQQNKVEEQQDNKSAVVNQETEQATSEHDEMLECQLCEMTFNGVKPLEQHIQSKII